MLIAPTQSFTSGPGQQVDAQFGAACIFELLATIYQLIPDFLSVACVELSEDMRAVQR